jgi:5'-methylthioadenosine phosphorylase
MTAKKPARKAAAKPAPQKSAPVVHDEAVGVMGGSGLYDLEGLEDVREIELSTPFGAPSDAYITGRLGGVRMVFLPRHGRGHRISPSEINFRANVWGMKKLGVTRIVSLSAVGSMRADVKPGDFVVIDQFFDRTRHRPDTFFDRGVVAHVMFADPVCPRLRKTLLAAGKKQKLRMHDGGTYINMEGPQFSTRAESKIYRKWGVDVIGMTNLQEAKLAREAEICYATVAMATDYDCWHEEHDDVTVEGILAVMHKNIGNAKKLILAAIPELAPQGDCPDGKALSFAIMTAKDRVPDEARLRLGLLIDKYMEK